MASRFLGGLAEGILDYRLKDQEQERELSSYERKQRLLKSMETTEEKDYDRGKIVTRDGNGNVKRERPMTNSEIKEYRLKMRNTVAATEGAEATAKVAAKGLENYDADRQLDIEYKQEGRDLQRAQLANTQASTASLIEDRNLRAQERKDAKAGEVDVVARESRDELIKGLRNLPTSNDPRRVQRNINKILTDVDREISHIKSSNASDAAKKAAIQKVIEARLVHLPAPSALSLDARKGGVLD